MSALACPASRPRPCYAGRDRFAGCAVAPSAGSLTPSGVRLKAPAAPGLFRVDGEITVKGSKCQGWVSPPQAREWVCGSRHKFPHRLFFCGCRLSAAAAESHPPQKIPRWGFSSESKGMGVRKQAQISPPPFFFAAVAYRRQRLEAIPPQKFPRWDISSASKGLSLLKQAQISPPPFFLRLSPIGGSG